MSSPLSKLVDLLPQGAHVGLHLIVVRSTASASRSMSDPVLRRLIDLATPVLLFSCPREEGMIVGGVRPMTLPPGRAMYITRRGVSLLQTAFVDTAAVTAGNGLVSGEARI
jgi:S-DNA-T family DNA segregation ATPase FtsK/SpoIIIE